MERVNQVRVPVGHAGAVRARSVSTQVVEQIVRPTGLVDPEVIVKPTKGQIDDLIEQINERVDQGRPRARHHAHQEDGRGPHRLPARAWACGCATCTANVDTIQRIEILRDLRLGEFDVLVGINLLREGLDLPEVSLVAILDADKEGFLRSETSLIQTIGRAARNVDGQVIMYADKVTDSMQRAISETNRRRELQQALQRRARHRPADDPQGGHRHPRPAAPGRRRRPVPGQGPPPPARARQGRSASCTTLPAAGAGAGSSRRSRRRCTRPPADLRFEYAARLRDEINDLRRELRDAGS